jgi:hypothetical protein
LEVNELGKSVTSFSFEMPIRPTTCCNYDHEENGPFRWVKRCTVD